MSDHSLGGVNVRYFGLSAISYSRLNGFMWFWALICVAGFMFYAPPILYVWIRVFVALMNLVNTTPGVTTILYSFLSYLPFAFALLTIVAILVLPPYAYYIRLLRKDKKEQL